MMNEMSFTDIYQNLIIKRECSSMPPQRVTIFLLNTSLADYIKKEILNIIYKNVFNEIIESSLSNPQIYTDASKINSGVAIAIINANSYRAN